jgi:hypothetical protein
MNDAMRLVLIYDLGRNYGMTHQESLAHAKLVVNNLLDLQASLERQERVEATAYIAIREEYPKEDAKIMVEGYMADLRENLSL